MSVSAFHGKGGSGACGSRGIGVDSAPGQLHRNGQIRIPSFQIVDIIGPVGIVGIQSPFAGRGSEGGHFILEMDQNSIVVGKLGGVGSGQDLFHLHGSIEVIVIDHVVKAGLEAVVTGLEGGSGSVAVNGVFFRCLNETVCIVCIFHQLCHVNAIAFCGAVFQHIGAVKITGNKEMVILGKGINLFGKLGALGSPGSLVLCQGLIPVVLPVGIEDVKFCIGILILQLDPLKCPFAVSRIAVALTAAADQGKAGFVVENNQTPVYGQRKSRIVL